MDYRRKQALLDAFCEFLFVVVIGVIGACAIYLFVYDTIENEEYDRGCANKTIRAELCPDSENR